MGNSLRNFFGSRFPSDKGQGGDVAAAAMYNQVDTHLDEAATMMKVRYALKIARQFVCTYVRTYSAFALVGRGSLQARNGGGASVGGGNDGLLS